MLLQMHFIAVAVLENIFENIVYIPPDQLLHNSPEYSYYWYGWI